MKYIGVLLNIILFSLKLFDNQLSNNCNKWYGFLSKTDSKLKIYETLYIYVVKITEDLVLITKLHVYLEINISNKIVYI